MNDKAKDYLILLAAREKQFDALYRKVSSKFNISDCAMWIIYYLVLDNEPLTQQDLIKKMIFPKQTINSSVIKLSKDGYVELNVYPGMRNRKIITLTESGEKLADATVRRLLAAELHAVEKIKSEHMEMLISLYDSFYEHLEEEFIREDLVVDKD